MYSADCDSDAVYMDGGGCVHEPLDIGGNRYSNACHNGNSMGYRTIKKEVIYGRYKYVSRWEVPEEG